MLEKIKAFFASLLGGKKSSPAPINTPSEPSKSPDPVVIPESGSGEQRAFNNFPDISHYEPCDFSKFKANDMITKATEGASIIDSTFKTNMEGCKKLGVRFGAYHFFIAKTDPIAQAKFFISTVGLDNLKSFYHSPIVDYETSKGQTEADMKNDVPDLKIFIKHVYDQTGRKVRLYTYETLLIYLNLDAEFFLQYCELPWLARYGKEPVNFKPWSGMWAWQYSDGEYSNNPPYSDSFEGIGRCDANKFYNPLQ